MNEKTVNNHATTRLSRLIARAKQIVLASVGKSVAELPRACKVEGHSRPIDDSLLRIDGYDGPIGPTATEDIDRTIYGV